MEKKWWNDKVAYQIYPKSFYDSNGDGIGDIRGIIEKLDYLKGLGIDILWLSPIFCSPLADQGYDISDYYNIDPRFGTMEDLDELIAEAKCRDMYIILDLVVNHCSDEHVWFKKACEDPDGKYGKYFYIRDIVDGKMPTNWRSYFGGSVWEKLPGHDDKCYMHLFHVKQPDLNWENKEVREEVYKMVNWWLDKGLGGFRIDAIINIKKAFPFRDYPADRPDGLCSTSAMLSEAKGVDVFLRELRDNTFRLHDSFSVGEVFDVDESEVADFISDDGYFSSMFDFNTCLIGQSPLGWHMNRKPTPEEYIATLIRSQNNVGSVGFLSSIIENHDEPRGVSHYLPKGEITLMGKKLLALISFMVRGIPFIYQGQEIGMENMEWTSIDQIDDISTLDQYEVVRRAGCSESEALAVISEYSRDNARTPMQWDDSDNAGFTSGRPWLTVNPKYKDINVKSQLEDSASLYNFYRELIALRKSPKYKNTIVYSDFIPYEQDDKRLMTFFRRDEDNTLFVVANFKMEECECPLPSPINEVLINNGGEVDVRDGFIHLSGYQALVLELKK